jgi:hypothetical protein
LEQVSSIQTDRPNMKRTKGLPVDDSEVDSKEGEVPSNEDNSQGGETMTDVVNRINSGSK